MKNSLANHVFMAVCDHDAGAGITRSVLATLAGCLSGTATTESREWSMEFNTTQQNS